jgi:hypothetical protein
MDRYRSCRTPTEPSRRSERGCRGCTGREDLLPGAIQIQPHRSPMLRRDRTDHRVSGADLRRDYRTSRIFAKFAQCDGLCGSMTIAGSTSMKVCHKQVDHLGPADVAGWARADITGSANTPFICNTAAWRAGSKIVGIRSCSVDAWPRFRVVAVVNHAARQQISERACAKLRLLVG